MAERFHLLCLASVAALALACPAVLAQVPFGELDFVVEPEPKGDPSHGYSEYRVFITNKGTENAHLVTLTLPAESNSSRGRGGSLQSISRTVQVGPGLTSVVSLYQPTSPDTYGDGIAVRIDGRLENKQLRLNLSSSRSVSRGHPYGYARHGRFYGAYGGGGIVMPLVLRSLRVSPQFNERKVAAAPVGPPAGAWGPGAPGGGPLPPPAPPPPPIAVPGGPMMGGGAAMGMPGAVVFTGINAAIVAAEMPVSRWTNHWLGLTRYDGIVVTREDVEELQRGSNDTRAILQALWQYTEAGGVLLVLGPGDVAVPAAWKRHSHSENGITIYPVGFGRCLITPDRNSPEWSTSRWSTVGATINQTVIPWQSSRPLADLNASFPVVDDLGVPVKGLFVLMILFGIALGPVNLVVLGRKKKRIWMLWTVPALSFVTCLLVFGYMVIIEGWQGHARVGGITFLDEIDRRATSLGRATFYSPLTPGDGLRFSEDTEVGVQGDDQGSSSSSCAIDWTQGQHLSRGWVTARVPAHFAVRRSETRRERLNVHREPDGTLSVLNGLGVDVKSLWLADEKGVLYTATDVPAGARATLARSDMKPVTAHPSETWRQLYTTNDWIKSAKTAQEKPRDHLAPRTYLAVVDGSPFHEQALRHALVRGTESVVLGIMADLGN